MKVRLLFFASLAERAGVSDETIEVPEGTTPESLWNRLIAERPTLAGVARPAFARNGDFAQPRAELADGDELAFLPPASGG
jgi:molybdopterin synthase catalytic subunit